MQIEVCLIIGYAVQALADKEVELGDSAPYFLDCAERLAHPGFLPSDEDILRYKLPIYIQIEKMYRQMLMIGIIVIMRIRDIDKWHSPQGTQSYHWHCCCTLSGDDIRLKPPSFYLGELPHIFGNSPRGGAQHDISRHHLIIDQTPKLKFELVDVGGQRSERKKWIQCFDNVTAGCLDLQVKSSQTVIESQH